MSEHRVVVALVVFSVIDGKLAVFSPGGALPRIFLHEQPLPDKAAETLLQRVEKGDWHVEQLYTFSSQEKHEPGLIVSYLALVPSFAFGKRKQGDFIVGSEIESRALDKQIVEYAIKRLRWKVEYTNVVYSLLPSEFTFSDLQKVYEAILDRSMDKRNFRKKILSLGILKDTGKKKALGRSRPAEVYSFKDRALTIVEIL